MGNAMDLDVIVVGGGHAGLAFARLLEALCAPHRPGLSVAVLDAGPAPAATPPAEVGLRVVAVSPGSRTILERCGAWPLLPADRVGPYRHMVVWHHAGTAGGARSLGFDATEAGVGELGYIIENEVLRSALWHAPGTAVTLMPGVRPEAVQVDADHARLRLEDGRLLSARLMVGADGHESWLRQAMGVGQHRHPYGQHAVVAHLQGTRPHRGTAWQRFLVDGPLALLPLADGRVSLVWSCPSPRAQELLAMDEASFNEAVSSASGRVLGSLRLDTARAGFELVAAQAEHSTGQRLALIGDAAHRIHPLAGQGVNLGFRDVAVLAQQLADHLRVPGADPGDAVVLRRFERSRQWENAMVMHAMTLLNAGFASAIPGLAMVAGLGLGAIDRLAGPKRWLAGFAMGRRGEVPDWVRDAGGAKAGHP